MVPTVGSIIVKSKSIAKCAFFPAIYASVLLLVMLCVVNYWAIVVGKKV